MYSYLECCQLSKPNSNLRTLLVLIVICHFSGPDRASGQLCALFVGDEKAFYLPSGLTSVVYCEVAGKQQILDKNKTSRQSNDQCLMHSVRYDTHTAYAYRSPSG